MKFIKSRESFLEKYNVATDESPQNASDKNQYNDNEFFIKEFPSKKTALDNIYKTYTDRTDLISKLKSQKLINGDGQGDEIRFINPLLQLWAQIASANREVDNIEKKTSEYTNQLNQQKAELSSNPESADLLNDQIKNTNNTILDFRKRLTELNNSISDVKKQIDDKIKEMTSSLQKSKDRIDNRDTNIEGT